MGVTHALHSPLMAVTNAVSGMTALGGMLAMNGGLVPASTGGALASLAVGASAVNIAGGFIVTQRMLDMFKREGDPDEHTNLYAIPAATLIGGYGVGLGMGGGAELTGAAQIASGALCIGAIAGLSSQTTSRAGCALGILGVSTGVATGFGSVDWAPSTYAQAAALYGIGGLAGHRIATTAEITSLPQMVAGFHSLVGLAAMATCVGSYMGEPLMCSFYFSCFKFHAMR